MLLLIWGQPLPAALPLAAACGTTWLLVSVPAPPPLRRLSPHQYRFRTALVLPAEQYIQDEVSGVSERRRAVAAALIIFALLVLFPMAPDVVRDVGSMGSPGNFI